MESSSRGSASWRNTSTLRPRAIYAAIGKSRTAWAQHPAIRELIDEIHGVLDRAGGAMPLLAAGTELLTRIAHGNHPDNVGRACALARVVVELDKDEPDGIRFVRLEGDTPWLLRREDLELPLKQLGAADELASREVLAGPAEGHRALEAIVAQTPLAALAADRLVRFAAAASRRAAASSRLGSRRRGSARSCSSPLGSIRDAHRPDPQPRARCVPRLVIACANGII